MTSQFTETYKRDLRTLARQSLGLASNAPLKKMIDLLNKDTATKFTEQNFYANMNKYYKHLETVYSNIEEEEQKKQEKKLKEKVAERVKTEIKKKYEENKETKTKQQKVKREQKAKKEQTNKINKYYKSYKKQKEEIDNNIIFDISHNGIKTENQGTQIMKDFEEKCKLLLPYIGTDLYYIFSYRTLYTKTKFIGEEGDRDIPEFYEPIIKEDGTYDTYTEDITTKNYVKISNKNYHTIFYQNIIPLLTQGGGSDTTNLFINEVHARFIIFKQTTIIPKKLEQFYLDGVKHCVIEPLRTQYQIYSNNSTTKDSKRKFDAVIKKLNKFEEQYKEGVPEEKMEEIAKAVSRCIIIKDLFGTEIKKYNETCRKSFCFYNARQNHLEKGELTWNSKYELINQDKMDQLIEEHDKEHNFYLFDGIIDKDGVKNGRSICSNKGCWAVKNEDYEIFKEFDEEIGKKNYGLNAVKYKELNEFIKEGRLINAAPTPLCAEPNNLHMVNHIDISKAYTQHMYSKYYIGFLGHIHSYSKLDKIQEQDSLSFLENHIGIYKVKILKNKDELLKLLGIFEGKIYTIPSAEIIAFIKDFNIKVKLISGCWGSSFNFNYNDKMLENRRYAIWAGKLGQDSEYNKYTFTGKKEWASHLKYQLGNENVYYFENQDMITIKKKKESYNTYHHILAFITSYTRLNMLEIMSKIKTKNLVKVILDGLYFKGELEDITIPHKKNNLKTHLGFREHWYYESEIDTKNWGDYDERFDGNVIFCGAGGTGKTYTTFNNKTLIEPLYVVPTNVLGKKFSNEYNRKYTTIHRLIGEDCESYKEMYGEPHTIMIDELTMIDERYIIKALELYQNTMFILAGDFDKKQWFQCRSGDGKKYSKIFMPEDWKYVDFLEDMRSKDDEIKQLKIDIRNQMKEIFTLDLDKEELGGYFGAGIINDYIKQNYNVINFKDAVKDFKQGDIWIAGTHKTNLELIKNGIISGYINKHREINDNGEGEKRGSFTIHSYQGLTIPDKKVFISLDNFEYAMLYTAVSRCCYFNQIVFVHEK